MQTLEQFILAGHSPSTTANYLYEIKNFIKTQPKARYLKYMDVIKYFAELVNKYPNVNTRIRILSAIKQYYNYLIFANKRSDHPCKSFCIRRKRTQIQIQNLFSMEELQMLMNRENRYENLGTRNKVIISLLIYQALTSAEIINLNVSNIDLDTGTIKIKASRNISGRTLYLNKSQIKLFDTYINDIRLKIKRTDTNRLILNKLGQAHGITIDGIFAVIEPLKSLFPDKILNPERIRMSVISHWLNDKKLPIEIVMDLSGQKWPSSIMMYKRIDVEEQRKIINRYHPLK